MSAKWFSSWPVGPLLLAGVISAVLGVCWLPPLLISNAEAEEAKTRADQAAKVIPGVVIGYATGAGLCQYSFKTERSSFLLKRRALSIADSLKNLAFDLKLETLFYVDLRHNDVRAWENGAQVPRPIHEVAKGYYVTWLVLSHDGQKLYFAENSTHLEERLLAYDRKTKEISVILRGLVTLDCRPAWVSESHMIVAARKSMINDKATWHIVDLDVTTGKVKPLPDLPGVEFALSPERKTLTLHADTWDIHIYEFPTLKLIRKIPRDRFPGGGMSEFCYAGEDHVMFSINPHNGWMLKTYLLDIHTGEYRKLFNGSLQGVQYLPAEPNWQTPGEDAP